MSEENVTFQGPAPFRLPFAQRAKAHGNKGNGNKGNGVTLTLYSIIEVAGPQPSPMDVQMTSKVARELAISLLQAADAAGD